VEDFYSKEKSTTEKKDPQSTFQENLAHTLAKSVNKKEFVNILKRKIINAA
jgi:hypothetical protein